MLTPLDIENKRFSKKINGYNADDVDDFLDQVTDDYEKLYRENAELKDAISKSKQTQIEKLQEDIIKAEAKLAELRIKVEQKERALASAEQ